jgi:allophanate hydrolase subunit 2
MFLNVGAFMLASNPLFCLVVDKGVIVNHGIAAHYGAVDDASIAVDQCIVGNPTIAILAEIVFVFNEATVLSGDDFCNTVGKSEVFFRRGCGLGCDLGG